MKHTPRGRAAVAATCAACLLAAAAALVMVARGGSGQGAEKEKERAVRGLERLREKYAALNSVHLAADVRLAVYGQPFRVGNGRFEYWAEGGRYRIKSLTDRHLGLKTDFDIAYDGKHFYLLDRRLGVLSLRQRDEARSPASLPNPLFLPVDYLSVDDDDCPFCVLRLPDFKSAQDRWAHRARVLEVKSQRREGPDGRVVSELEMPGGRLGERAYKIRVGAVEVGGDDVRPSRIERVGPDGKPMTSISFDDFRPTPLGAFPHSIVVQAFGDDGNVSLRADFTVTSLRMNEPLPAGTFTIGFDEAEAVWDSDEKKFLKEKRPGPAPPGLK